MPKKQEQPLTEKKVQKIVDKAVDDVAQATNATFQKVEKDIAEIKVDISGVKQDVSGLQQDVSGLQQDVSGLQDDMTEVKEDIRSLKSGQAAILKVVQGIDKQLKEHATHPQRITRLERAVFR